MNWLVFAASRGDDEKLFCGGAGEKRVVRCGAFCVVGLFFLWKTLPVPSQDQWKNIKKEEKEGPTQDLKTLL